MGTSASKSAANLTQNNSSSNININTSNLRSNSRTSVGGHSASNVSNGGSVGGGTGNVNIVSSKLSEQ